MDLEFVTEKLSVKINSESYNLALITMDEAEECMKLIDAGGTDASAILKVKRSVLVKAGLPDDIIGKLQMATVNGIFDALCGAKKN